MLNLPNKEILITSIGLLLINITSNSSKMFDG
jgi:hypothetical protein